MSISDCELSNIDSNDSTDYNDGLNNGLNDGLNFNNDNSYNDNSYNDSYINHNMNKQNNQNQYNDSNNNKKTKTSNKNELDVKNNKREVNYNATLAAVHERQERLAKMKARIDQKNKNEDTRLRLIGGLELLYNIIKKQNIKLVNKIQNEFTTSLPFNINLQSTVIKPPYLTPKIVSHRMEKLLNET